MYQLCINYLLTFDLVVTIGLPLIYQGFLLSREKHLVFNELVVLKGKNWKERDKNEKMRLCVILFLKGDRGEGHTNTHTSQRIFFI